MDELEAKKQELSTTLAAQNVLTDSVQMEIDAADTIDTLDEIYTPFKKQIKTKGQVAKEKGLKPLMWRILNEGFWLTDQNPTEEELEGCRDIIAEEICRLPEIKEAGLTSMQSTGQLITKKTEFAQRLIEAQQEKNGTDQEPSHHHHRKVVKGLMLTENANDPKTYQKYYDAKFNIKKLKSSQILAINRAEKLGFLSVNLAWNPEALFNLCIQKITANHQLTVDSMHQIALAVQDGLHSILKGSIETRARVFLTEKAMAEAMETFSMNLWSLLLAAPVVDVAIMGIDPGFRTGCKLCVCNDQGALLETTVIYPFCPRRKTKASTAFIEMIRTHQVKVIALGDGVASRETESFISQALKEASLAIGWSLVSEDGASVYSASELASHEFPDLDVSLRGAVSIARRLQDPLAELVKIDPPHLGVGLYQHDMDRIQLAARLRGVVESAVNTVGVDLNTASPSLLSYVAGLSPTFAERIVNQREHLGAFRRREQLLEVEGINGQIFQQCAGFLRIREGDDALDNTGVHPESYHIIHALLEQSIPDRMLSEHVSRADLNLLREYLMGHEQKQGKRALEELARSMQVGLPTLCDIIENVMSPGRDIRGRASTTAIKWRELESIKDLEIGDQMMGTVKNVVEFGAFVDINIGINGLVHVGQMKGDESRNSQIKIDPHQVVKVGDKINVEVLSIDLDRNRILLKLIDHELS